MTQDDRLGVGDLFGELGSQLHQNAALAGGTLAVLVAANLALDYFSQSGSAAGSGVAGVVAQLYFTRAVLIKNGLLPSDSKPHFFRFWWMNILITIGIVLGCLLFILPGVYLAARWFVVAPVLIGEDRTSGEAMRESWNLTKASVWRIVGAILVLYGVGFGGAGVAYVFGPEEGNSVGFDGVAYVFIFGAYVCSWLMAVGAYTLLSQRAQSLEEVFA